MCVHMILAMPQMARGIIMPRLLPDKSLEAKIAQHLRKIFAHKTGTCHLAQALRVVQTLIRWQETPQLAGKQALAPQPHLVAWVEMHILTVVYVQLAVASIAIMVIIGLLLRKMFMFAMHLPTEVETVGSDLTIKNKELLASMYVAFVHLSKSKCAFHTLCYNYYIWKRLTSQY